jgi:hypothetical protein
MIITSKIPEFTQLDRVKSMMRYFPPNGTAGFVRFAVSVPSLEPSPPARITARYKVLYPTQTIIHIFNVTVFHPIISYIVLNIPPLIGPMRSLAAYRVVFPGIRSVIKPSMLGE